MNNNKSQAISQIRGASSMLGGIYIHQLTKADVKKIRKIRKDMDDLVDDLEVRLD